MLLKSLILTAMRLIMEKKISACILVLLLKSKILNALDCNPSGYHACASHKIKGEALA